MSQKVLLVLGTRPEGIKMAPVYLALKDDPEIDVRLCSTGQHREMLDQVFDFFSIKPDYDLKVMKQNQTLTEVSKNILEGIDAVFDDFTPDVVLVQGDTTTVLMGALAAFYRGVKVGHVEAGLRTWDIHTPFPEEANRVLTSRITDYHFAPTEGSRENLLKDGIKDDAIYVTGNTVTDAILLAKDIVQKDSMTPESLKGVDFHKKIILTTAHRRENLGERLEEICRALATLADRDDVEMVFPMHLNPKVREVVHRHLDGRDNVHLIEPLAYPDLVWALDKSYIVLTDSGGIQEEAPALGKPVLVMREETERPEGIEAGTAMLVGADYDVIMDAATRLLDDEDAYAAMAQAVNPYGDGRCSGRIVEILKKNAA